MARLFIANVGDVSRDGRVQCLVLGEGESYSSLAIRGTSAATTNPIPTPYVELTTDVDCHVAFGASPTAVNTSGSEVGIRMQAGQSKVFAIAAPGTTKIAVIQSA
jgi:hypothetical protein